MNYLYEHFSFFIVEKFYSATKKSGTLKDSLDT